MYSFGFLVLVLTAILIYHFARVIYRRILDLIAYLGLTLLIVLTGAQQ
jgi:hypothetical protein